MLQIIVKRVAACLDPDAVCYRTILYAKEACFGQTGTEM
jgi:hypothetical protein